MKPVPRVRIALLALLGLLAAAGAGALAPALAQDAALAQKAHDLLKARCFQCHGQNGVATRNLFVLDRARLISSKTVVPGDPTSPLLKAVESGAMPPGAVKLLPEEIQTLKGWITAGAPDWAGAPAAARKFLSEAQLIGLIEQDLKQAKPTERASLRYYSIAHLYNAGVPDAELEGYRIGLSRLVNSLSWGQAIVPPRAVDPAKLLLRIRLEDYRWDRATWKAIVARYPYGVTTQDSGRVYNLSGAELPYVRADWFVASASVPPLYHQVLGLPGTVEELEQVLRVNPTVNLAGGQGVFRAGMRSSGVSKNNRVVERHQTRYGSYWKSYDFGSNQGEKNIFRDPLAFRADGGEMIFSLPNGLQGYFIADSAGKRLDAAPVEIVSDRNFPDAPQVVNGRSCMSCHYAGTKDFKDEVRSVVEKVQAASFDRQKALSLYRPRAEIEPLLTADAQRFRKAAELAGGTVSVDALTEPMSALARKFGAELTIAEAAAEVGMEVKTFQDKLGRTRPLLDLGLGQLLVESGGFKRDAWESLYGDVIRGLGVGTYVTPQGAALAAPALPSKGTGMLVVAGDTWMTSDTGFAFGPPGATARFVVNVARLFAGGKKAHFLVYSTHWAFQENPFQATLRQAGYRVTCTMEPGELTQYDGVFLGGNEVDRPALARYLEGGGKVYVAPAAAAIKDERNWWNTFLNPYGIQLVGHPPADRVVMTPTSQDPVLAGVRGLFVRGPYGISLLPGEWPYTHVIDNQFGVGMVAVYRADGRGQPLPQ